MKARKILLPLMTALLLGSCEVPDAPLGVARPSSIPSESPNSGDPICLQTLECVITNTNNNSVRKQTQDVLDQLFRTGEPEYTRLCESQAEELSANVSQCKK